MFHGKKTMMNQFIGLFITMTVLSCFCMAECPTKEQSVQVDAVKMSGIWYVMSAIHPPRQPPSKCGQMNVTSPSSDKINIEYQAFSLHGNVRVLAVINATLGDEFTGIWSLQVPFTKRLGSFTQRVIDVDYDSHLVLLACENSSAVKFAMIWSREKSLSSEVLEALKEKVATYAPGVNMVDVDQSC